MIIVPIILCGGSGTRLWPLSRELYAKQWLSLLGEQSLFQNTLNRISNIPEATKPIIVCNYESRHIVKEQLNQFDVSADILFEPCGRNTGPAIAAAAMYAKQQYDNPYLLVLPADHLIKDISAFQTSIKTILKAISTDMIVNLVIKPQWPDVGYGYIHVSEKNQGPFFKVEQFVEKPELSLAEKYYSSDHYFWNTAIFMSSAKCLLQEFSEYAPALLNQVQDTFNDAMIDENNIYLTNEKYQQIEAIAIDHLIMEKTKRLFVYPLPTDWSDIGSWSHLWHVDKQDNNGNVCYGDVAVENVHSSYLRAESRMLAVTGIDDCVVVETKDAVLVTKKNNSTELKKLVYALQERGRNEIRDHSRVQRPWGSYESLEHSDRFKVKNITVKPGHKLSLQIHHHRAEHWIIVSGTAKVTVNENQFILTENQTTYIPVGTEHRLENIGKISLVMIEVQIGSYLEEDDILRIDDDYGRDKKDHEKAF